MGKYPHTNVREMAVINFDPYARMNVSRVEELALDYANARDLAHHFFTRALVTALGSIALVVGMGWATYAGVFTDHTGVMWTIYVVLGLATIWYGVTAYGHHSIFEKYTLMVDALGMFLYLHVFLDSNRAHMAEYARMVGLGLPDSGLIVDYSHIVAMAQEKARQIEQAAEEKRKES